MNGDMQSPPIYSQATAELKETLDVYCLSRNLNPNVPESVSRDITASNLFNLYVEAATRLLESELGVPGTLDSLRQYLATRYGLESAEASMRAYIPSYARTYQTTAYQIAAPNTTYTNNSAAYYSQRPALPAASPAPLNAPATTTSATALPATTYAAPAATPATATLPATHSAPAAKSSSSNPPVDKKKHRFSGLFRKKKESPVPSPASSISASSISAPSNSASSNNPAPSNSAQLTSSPATTAIPAARSTPVTTTAQYSPSNPNVGTPPVIFEPQANSVQPTTAYNSSTSPVTMSRSAGNYQTISKNSTIYSGAQSVPRSVPAPTVVSKPVTDYDIPQVRPKSFGKNTTMIIGS
ncbi:hypothetical protein TRVA0_055S00474 [Trichomonascus vanleenenianus]|uniref:uncharacterized protein n=1 Tax=Trichomonascus vanleenenianus TaxID=2268995 RepID=UPI003ECB7E44